MTLEQAKIGIKAASLVGFISGIILILYSLMLIITHKNIGIIGLCYGLFILILTYLTYYKKNKYAAMGLLASFLISLLFYIFYVKNIKAKTLVFQILWLMAYIQGVRGTIVYNKNKDTQP